MLLFLTTRRVREGTRKLGGPALTSWTWNLFSPIDKMQNLLGKTKVKRRMPAAKISPCAKFQAPLLARNLEIYWRKSVMFTVQRFELDWFRSVLHAYIGPFTLLKACHACKQHYTYGILSVLCNHFTKPEFVQTRSKGKRYSQIWDF